MKKQIFSVADKTAVVTGGCGFLGRMFCETLAAGGANVVVVDQSNETEHFAELLAKKYSVRTLGVMCDLTDAYHVQQLARQSIEKFKQIDILLNNAAGKSDSLDEFFKPFEEYSLKTWQQVMASNVESMFLVAQAFGKHMKENKSGSIIQTSSIYGVVAPDMRIYKGSYYLNREISSPAVYSASKAAVIGLTQYLATYWAPFQVRVNTLTPGGVESGQNDVFKEKYSARVPMGRMAEPEDLNGAMLYLASDASRYVTGQNLIIDGGLTVW